MKKIAILGATGSIGSSTLEVVKHHKDAYEVTLLVAHKSTDKMLALIKAYHPRYVALMDESAAKTLRDALPQTSRTQVLIGHAEVEVLLKSQEIDTVVAAIVGSAGLKLTLAAIQGGHRILLANKESLVMTGALFMQEARRHQAEILPTDSEHNAIFQSLPVAAQQQLGRSQLSDFGVHKVLLTGSGGPFLNRPLRTLADVTPEEACRHPNWSMGQKISVDSATMMNKGLEYIEARWLFHLSSSQIDIVIHPQSVIHSMVQYQDGSTIAQLGQPDMRTPIAHSLAYPDRIHSGVPPLDFTQLGALDFCPPDLNKFPNLKLAIDAFEQGQAATTVLNAANEQSVQAFLNQRIKFTDIAALNLRCLDTIELNRDLDLDSMIHLDAIARQTIEKII